MLNKFPPHIFCALSIILIFSLFGHGSGQKSLHISGFLQTGSQAEKLCRSVKQIYLAHGRRKHYLDKAKCNKELNFIDGGSLFFDTPLEISLLDDMLAESQSLSFYAYDNRGEQWLLSQSGMDVQRERRNRNKISMTLYNIFVSKLSETLIDEDQGAYVLDDQDYYANGYDKHRNADHNRNSHREYEPNYDDYAEYIDFVDNDNCYDGNYYESVRSNNNRGGRERDYTEHEIDLRHITSSREHFRYDHHSQSQRINPPSTYSYSHSQRITPPSTASYSHSQRITPPSTFSSSQLGRQYISERQRQWELEDRLPEPEDFETFDHLDDDDDHNNHDYNNNDHHSASRFKSIQEQLAELSDGEDDDGAKESEKCFCLEGFTKKDGFILDCGHIFHPECLDEMKARGQNRCPVCKKAGLDSGTVMKKGGKTKKDKKGKKKEKNDKKGKKNTLFSEVKKLLKKI